MKKILSVTLTILITVIASVSILSCNKAETSKQSPEKTTEQKEQAEESKLGKIFKDLNKESGFHMKYSLETAGVSLEQDLYKKGDQAYMDTLSGDVRSIIIVKGTDMYILDEASKTAVYQTLTEEEKAQVEASLNQMDSIFEIGNNSDQYTKGTVKIDGMNYDTEDFSSEKGKSSFVFNDDGELVYIIVSGGDQEIKIKIDALNGNIDDAQFEVPAEYQIIDSSGQEVSTDPYTPADSSLSTSSADNMTSVVAPSAEGSQTVTCEAGGFSFKTGQNYIVNISSQYVDVYLITQSTLPAFHVYPMMQVSGDTVDSFLERTIDLVKENNGNKLIGEPEWTTITVNGKKIKGFRYSYSTDDGKDVVMAETYLDLIDDTFYNWGTSYMRGDSVTPVECRLAMESFTLE